MRAHLADRIGFCFGVKRAIAMAEEALKKRTSVCSLGPIIHNAQVVERLSGMGLRIVRDLSRVTGGTIVISSHGAPPALFREMRKRGLSVVDTTCPFVAQAQRIAGTMSRDGYRVVIVGERAHPEVKALAGFAAARAVVVKDAAEAFRVRGITGKKIAVISQTTQAIDRYLAVAQALVRRCPREIRIFNTICDDTARRQQAASVLARKVDAMVIIGGKNSANTNRLFEVCRRLNTSHLVETEGDLSPRWFAASRSVGIASGASTPGWVIEKVVGRIKNLKERGCIVHGKRRTGRKR